MLLHFLAAARSGDLAAPKSSFSLVPLCPPPIDGRGGPLGSALLRTINAQTFLAAAAGSFFLARVSARQWNLCSLEHAHFSIIIFRVWANLDTATHQHGLARHSSGTVSGRSVASLLSLGVLRCSSPSSCGCIGVGFFR